MSRLFLDTNILIDLVSQDRPEHAPALSLVQHALLSNASISALASSLKDVYYLYRRHYGSEKAARESIRDLRNLLTIVDLTLPMVDAALGSDEPDYEDGLIRAAAELMGADMIVTRDDAAFSGSFVPSMTAREALAHLQ